MPCLWYRIDNLTGREQNRQRTKQAENKADRKQSGVVRFYRNSDAMDEGALFEIKFSDASCVHYRNVSQGDASVKTIVMTLPSVRMGGDEFS